MRIKQNILAALAALVLAIALAPALPAAAQAQWGVARALHIGGEGGWDYITVDSATHRLFVTRQTHTQVIDATTGKVLGDIPGQIRSHGVALVPALNRGFITDGGGSGAIVIFDLKTYAVLGKLATMPDSDGIIYDAALNRIFAVSGDGNALMTFRPDIDPKTGKIDAPIAPGGHPVGLSIDKARHRLFIGCRNPQKLVVMSTENGRVLAAVPIGPIVDATAFNAGHAFASCGGDGSLIVAGEKSGKFVVEQVVQTRLGARTMGLDPVSHNIYLPTAELEAPQPGAPAARAKSKPGMFMIVEVARQ